MAAKELEKKTNILEEIECKVQIQKGIVEKERKSLDAVRLRVQEVCQKCYLPPRLDVFTEAEESLTEYKEELMKVQISYGNYRNGISSAKVQKEYLEGIDADLDDIRYDLNHMIRNEREKRGSLNSVMEQLALTDYEEIRERLEHCIERLEKLPSEIGAPNIFRYLFCNRKPPLLTHPCYLYQTAPPLFESLLSHLPLERLRIRLNAVR